MAGRKISVIHTEHRTTHLLAGIFFCTPLAIGGFHECVAAMAACILLACLCYIAVARGNLAVPCSLTMIALVFYPVSMVINIPWSVDGNLFGFVKFMAVPLFALALVQQEKSLREKLLFWLPEYGSCLVVLSAVLQFIPALQEHLLIDGRLAGPFSYPNTFAAFLLVCMIPLFFTKRLYYRVLLCAVALLGGIAMTGSRTVFVLLIPVILSALIFGEVKSTKLTVVGGGVLLVIGVFLAGGDIWERITQINLQSSTLLGRLLYAKDALPVILSHPMGLGYQGYAYLQGSFQTGVYTVSYVHNDWLQAFLDGGWLAGILLLAAIGVSVFGKRTSKMQKMIVLTIFAHGLFDFDMQFLAMWFVLILALDIDGTKVITMRFKSKPFVVTLTALPVALCLFLGVANATYYLGRIDVTLAMLPNHTFANLAVIGSTSGLQQSADAADRILSHNKAVPAAWDIKAKQAFSEGDFAKVMEYSRRKITYAPYDLAAYEDYLAMLDVGAELYRDAGDAPSAEICIHEMATIPEKMAEALANTDPLAWKIVDRPELTLGEDSQRILEKYGVPPQESDARPMK